MTAHPARQAGDTWDGPLYLLGRDGYEIRFAPGAGESLTRCNLVAAGEHEAVRRHVGADGAG